MRCLTYKYILKLPCVFSSFNYFVVRVETLQLGEGLVQEGINGTARRQHGKHNCESGSFGIMLLK